MQLEGKTLGPPLMADTREKEAALTMYNLPLLAHV